MGLVIVVTIYWLIAAACAYGQGATAPSEELANDIDNSKVAAAAVAALLWPLSMMYSIGWTRGER